MIPEEDAKPAAETPEEGTPVEEPATDIPEIDPVEALVTENAGLKDQVLRLAAEMENLRKRTTREANEARTYAIAGFARDMLTATDSLSRALAVVPPELRETGDASVKSLIEGLEMTEREMQRLLQKNGVKPILAEGERFDPHQHQAMFEVPDADAPDGTVVQVVQAGFAIGDRILRPAMVGVAKTKAPSGGAASEKSDAPHVDKKA